MPILGTLSSTIKRMSDRTDALRKALTQIESAVSQMRRELDGFDNTIPKSSRVKLNLSSQESKQQTISSSSLSSFRGLSPHQVTAKSPLGPSELAVLSAIALLGRAQPLEMHHTLIAALAGYIPSDKDFRKALNSLSEQELISSTAHISKLTERGSHIVVAEGAQLTSELLAEKVAVQLMRHQRIIFQFLFEKRGAGVHRDEIAGVCGRGKNDKVLQKAMSVLQDLSLIKRVSNDNYACAEMLFLDCS
jgi:hypothetical protein